MTRILGIDPGAQVTGYGIIDHQGKDSRMVTYGTLRLGSGGLPERLGRILTGISELIALHQPAEFAIEDVFVSKNAKSALTLGHARGAAICAAVDAALPVHEYATRRVKQTVVGYGGADKAQVQHMVKNLLGIREAIAVDAADALAIALCHAHHREAIKRMERINKAMAS